MVSANTEHRGAPGPRLSDRDDGLWKRVAAWKMDDSTLGGNLGLADQALSALWGAKQLGMRGGWGDQGFTHLPYLPMTT